MIFGVTLFLRLAQIIFVQQSALSLPRLRPTEARSRCRSLQGLRYQTTADEGD